MRMTIALFAVLATLSLLSPALAQNPCEEIGSDCRAMSGVEVKALKERVLAAKAALPIPDPSRYAHDGAVEASTMPFVAETGIPGAVPTCRSWPAGCFTTLNTRSFGYVRRAERGKTGDKPKDIVAAAQQMMAGFENRVEVNVWLRPHSHLVDDEGGKCVDVSDPEAVNVERPAKAFAPVKSLELQISGPKAEVAALKKKIDRRAFEALLGAVVK